MSKGESGKRELWKMQGADIGKTSRKGQPDGRNESDELFADRDGSGWMFTMGKSGIEMTEADETRLALGPSGSWSLGTAESSTKR